MVLSKEKVGLAFDKGKGFCFFVVDVLCSFRVSDDLVVMERCYKCPVYERFMREMEEDDEAMMDAIDREREWLESEKQLDVLDDVEKKYLRKKWGLGKR